MKDCIVSLNVDARVCMTDEEKDIIALPERDRIAMAALVLQGWEFIRLPSDPSRYTIGVTPAVSRWEMTHPGRPFFSHYYHPLKTLLEIGRQYL